MKKNFLLAATALSILGFVNQAHAGCDGIYLAGRGGIVNHNVGDNSESLGTRIEVDDNAWMVAGAIGYRYGYFRGELEYTYREKSEQSANPGGMATKTEFQTLSYMLNVYYDFSPYTMFTPYVMGGLGMTNIQYTSRGGGFGDAEYETDNFTWAVGGGLSAKVTNRFNVDVGYRFLNMGELEKASIRAHEIYMGLRYVF